MVAVKVVFGLLRVVDQGEAFSTPTVRLLLRLKVLVGITAAYEVLGLVGVWVAAWDSMGPTKAYMLPPWVAAEVVALSLFTLVALLERLFAAVLEAICAALDCRPGRPHRVSSERGPRRIRRHRRPGWTPSDATGAI